MPMTTLPAARSKPYPSARPPGRAVAVTALVAALALPPAAASATSAETGPPGGAEGPGSEAGESRGEPAGVDVGGLARDFRVDLPPLEAGAVILGTPRVEVEHPRLRTTPPSPVEPDRWVPSARLLTATEIGAILGLGGVQYWIGKGGYPHWGLSDWPARFSADAQILDTNDFETNYSYHTVAGASYHVAARSNDLSVLEAAAWNLGASLVWEYVVEFRDKSDINDILFTTPAGLAMGEFTHRLGRLLGQRDGGVGWDIARWTLGFPQALNDSVTGADRARGVPIDHDFRIGMGLARGVGTEERAGERARDAGELGYLRFSGTLSAFGDRADRTRGWRGFTDANITSLDVEVGGGQGDRRNTYALSDTVLAGFRYADGAKAGPGRELHLGTSTAVRYHRERYGTWRDQFGMAHFPGLAIDGAVRGSGWGVRGLARLHPDYGGVHALGYGDWQDENPDEHGISAIEEENYYHAWGGSARLGAEISASALRAGGSLFWGAYRPHLGLDEFRQGRPHHEEDIDRGPITMEQHIRSRFFDYELWIGAELPRDLFVQARTVSRARREQFESFDTQASARRVAVELGTSF